MRLRGSRNGLFSCFTFEKHETPKKCEKVKIFRGGGKSTRFCGFAPKLAHFWKINFYLKIKKFLIFCVVRCLWTFYRKNWVMHRKKSHIESKKINALRKKFFHKTVTILFCEKFHSFIIKIFFCLNFFRHVDFFTLRTKFSYGCR